ncbi:hypothetical protein, conserved [Eimeria praecox]|uniref:Uncharacterized protein n=1 Tax=Eimeria praecox TaxID=51316 RepID=U6H444_9EIME|nr:hypothetical protein, conserved [Eimeria praecox]
MSTCYEGGELSCFCWLYALQFIDQGRTAEEVLAEMKAKSLAPGRVAAMNAFASAVENGEFNSSVVAEFFPLSAVVFLAIAALIFLLLLCYVGPLVCCTCCRFCCCCVRQRAHTKGGRIPCYLAFGSILAVLAVAVAIGAYRVDRKALDEATAVICAGGRSVDAVLYGTRSGMAGTGQGERLGFAGIKNLLDGSRKVAEAADGKNPNNVVEEVKAEIRKTLNLDHEKKLFKNSRDATLGNLQVTQDITDRASHSNIFVKEHASSLVQALNKVDNQLDSVDISTRVLEALGYVELPPADLSVFDDANDLMDGLSDGANFVGNASLSAEAMVNALDFALLCVSAISGAVVIMAVLTLIWQLLRPNKCARRTLGALTIIMTILSVIVCIAVAVVSLLHKLAMPACDYAAVRFIDINSAHPVAQAFGEDSVMFQLLSVCLSETSNGDLLQAEDGTNRIDPILEKLEDAKKEICEEIPPPPVFDFPDLKNADRDARLQSWAVILKNPLSFGTFPESGIQEPDSEVPLLQSNVTIYGLETVRNLVQPWQIAISDSATPTSLTVTSQAPSPENLEQWFQQCMQSNKADCTSKREAVLLLKKKIAMMVSKATCYQSSTGSQGRACTVTELMGGVGGSPVPQNALDRSVADAVDAVKQLQAKVEGSSDAACNIAANKIGSLSDEVLKLKQGSNCRFARDRFIRLTSHLCYGTIDGLGTGSALYFVLAIVMLLFSLLLLLLIIEDRDNDRYRETLYTEEGAAERTGGAPEVVTTAPPAEMKDTENSNAVGTHDGNGDAPEEVAKMPQEEMSVDSGDLKRLSRSEGAHGLVASDGIAPRMASVP